jgi:hypothetical protein
MIIPFPMSQIGDEERLRALMSEQKAEIEEQRIMIEKLKERLERQTENESV